VPDAEGDAAEALDAELADDADDADEWLAVLAEAELADEAADTEAEDTVLAEEAVTLAALAVEAALEVAAPVEEAPLIDADWPTQLESGPAWMVMGEEYWMLPTLSRTWMVMEDCAGRFTVQTSWLPFCVGKLSRAVAPG